jgi:hypothetical protein
VSFRQPDLFAVLPRPGIPSPAGLLSLIGRTSLPIPCVAIAVFGVPFILFYRLILFHFYVRGSFPQDTGLLASLMWHSTSALNLPPSLGGFSFFAQHVAPVLILVSVVSEFLPLTMPQLFASFVGLCHGLLALAVFWLLVCGYGMRRGWPLVLAALASAAFAFNGLAIAIVRFPHFETLAAACLLMSFVALVLGHRSIAAAGLLFALATREDAGLHAFGFLTVWAGINWLRSVPWRQNIWIAGFAGAGLIYSTVALMLQHAAFPGSSSFVRVYLGDPPLAHVTATLLADRLRAWFWLHPAIILPAIATLTWSIRFRDPYIAAGYVACVPWAVLHLLAASDLAGLMVGYYAYPFLVAMAWPWLGVLIRRGQEPPQRAPSARWPAACLLAMTGLSLLPIGADYDPGRITLPEAFLNPPSAARQLRTDRAVAAIAAARPALGKLLVDRSVAALLPLAFARGEVAGTDVEPAGGPADTVVFLADGFDAARLGAAPGLPVHGAVPGTAIRIMTDRPESTLRDWAILP